MARTHAARPDLHRSTPIEPLGESRLADLLFGKRASDTAGGVELVIGGIPLTLPPAAAPAPHPAAVRG